MIEAIKNLGLIHLNQELGERDSIRTVQEFSKVVENNPTLVAKLLAERVGSVPENIKVFVISDEDNQIYEEEYDAENYWKYLYKEPFGSKSPYLVPSFKLSEKPKETIRRLNNCLKKENIHLPELKDLFIQFSDEITTHLNDKTKHEKDKTSFYTFKLKGKYLGEIENITRQFIKVVCRDFKRVKKVDSLGQGICSMCQREREVYGVGSPLKFFTVEKEGFFPDFDSTYSWKSFPVCNECALLLTFGKVYIENHLNTYIAHPCYLIPSFSFIEKRDDFKSLDDFVNIASKRIFIKSEDIENVRDYENCILEQEKILGLTYNLLFYEKTNAAFNIVKHVETILPSRITEIFNAVETVEKHYVDNRWFPIEKNSNYGLDLTFRFLNRIFNVKRAKQSGKIKKTTVITSLDLIEDIFHKNKIDKNNLFTDLSNHLQRIYLDQIGKKKETIRARLYTEIREITKLLEFLIKVEVLNMENNKSFRSIEGEVDLSGFFKEYNQVYGNPAKQVCFIAGVLFGKLEVTQLARLKSNPCLAWLKSMNLSKGEIERIYWKTIEKFKQYHNHPYPAFTERVKQISQSFDYGYGASGNNWDITVDEIRFFFTMGWTLSDRFLPKAKEEEKEVEK